MSIQESELLDLVKYSFNYVDGKFFWKSKKPGVVIGKQAGTFDYKGYRCIVINRKSYKAHRLVFLFHHGYLPKCIDHINGIKSDNRIENLREATESQNKANRGKTKVNTSGFKGVFKAHHGKKWRAQIKHGNKQIFLGKFDNKEEAYAKYIESSKKYFGDFARV